MDIFGFIKGVGPWVMGNYPVVGSIMLFLGGLFVILELFFKAEGEQPGEAKWKALKTGYLAPYISYLINYFYKMIGKKD